MKIFRMVKMMDEIIEDLMVNFTNVIIELKISEVEYVMFRLLSFFNQTQGISQDGVKKLGEYRAKYVQAFTHAVYHSHPKMEPLELLSRVSRLMSLLTVIEARLFLVIMINL